MQPTIALSSPMAQAFFHQHPDAVLVLDAAGKVLLANAAAQWLAGPDGEFADFAQMTGTPWPEPSVTVPLTCTVGAPANSAALAANAHTIPKASFLMDSVFMANPSCAFMRALTGSPDTEARML